MKLASFEAIVRAFEEADVRYLVAGGLAVNAHGYLRFTHDIDLVIQLSPSNVVSAFRALSALGYQPRVPVTAEQFADDAQRQRWVTEKGMRVLNFHSDRHRESPIDVFVTEPFDFDSEYELAPSQEFGPGLSVRFVSNQIPDELWEETTWEGNRRAQLRRALELTLRERLQAVEDMAEVAERFLQMRTHGRKSAEKQSVDVHDRIG